MKVSIVSMALLVVTGATVLPAHAAQGGVTPVAAPPARVVQVGPGQIRVGRIMVDKNESSFSIPGRVTRLAGPDVPLEFVAVSRGGARAYESLLELDAAPTDFNLACILIGLQQKPGSGSRRHFDPEPVTGDAVRLEVQWQAGGELRRVQVTEWISAGEDAATAQWVYTGSQFISDGRYLPTLDGTLIGFVHDPASIIDHASGMGLGDYGAITPNDAQRPPAGTPVVLKVSRGRP